MCTFWAKISTFIAELIVVNLENLDFFFVHVYLLLVSVKAFEGLYSKFCRTYLLSVIVWESVPGA